MAGAARASTLDLKNDDLQYYATNNVITQALLPMFAMWHSSLGMLNNTFMYVHIITNDSHIYACIHPH